MKDFRFLSAVARTEQEIPAVMESLLAPYDGQIAAFHHDVTPRGQQFIVTYTIQLVHVQSDGGKTDGKHKGIPAIKTR